MKLGHEFALVSGVSTEDCHWIGYRFDKKYGFSPENGDSWVGQSLGDDSHMLISQTGWMTGIWRSEARVWVSHASGHVHMNPSLEVRKEEWQILKVNASLSGIWGLRDDMVFVWGLKGRKPVTYLYDGKGWNPIEAPGHVGAIRGIREDLIYAVGLKGLIARWNGSAFEAVDNPSNGNLSDVFVVSDDEMYACGQDGDLMRGSDKGWEPILKHDGALHCVARWKDTVWVGGGPEGLFALVKGKLKMRKDNVWAERFDARGNLVMACPDAIVETQNGVDYTAMFVETFERLSASQKPHWK